MQNPKDSKRGESEDDNGYLGLEQDNEPPDNQNTAQPDNFENDDSSAEVLARLEEQRRMSHVSLSASQRLASSFGEVNIPPSGQDFDDHHNIPIQAAAHSQDDISSVSNRQIGSAGDQQPDPLLAQFLHESLQPGWSSTLPRVAQNTVSTSAAALFMSQYRPLQQRQQQQTDPHDIVLSALRQNALQHVNDDVHAGLLAQYQGPSWRSGDQEEGLARADWTAQVWAGGIRSNGEMESISGDPPVDLSAASRRGRETEASAISFAVPFDSSGGTSRTDPDLASNVPDNETIVAYPHEGISANNDNNSTGLVEGLLDTNGAEQNASSGSIFLFRLPMASPSGTNHFSPFDSLARRQMELFAYPCDEDASELNSRVGPAVGIQCRHCAETEESTRTGRHYQSFPSRLETIGENAKTLAKVHLCEACPRIPQDIKHELLTLLAREEEGQDDTGTCAGTGTSQDPWAESVRLLGIIETAEGLRLASHLLT